MALVKLGTILNMEKGKKPINQSATAKVGYLPYCDIKAFETGVVDSYADGKKCLSCKSGDVLIVCDGSRSGLVGFAIDGYVGSTLAKLSADGIDNKYLYYFLMSKYALLNTRKKGTGTPHVNQDILKESIINSLPVNEQQLIVNRIEELFSELDKAEETLLKTKAQLEVYKQAVLKEAFEHSEEWEQYKFVELMESIKNGYGIKPTDDGEYPIFKISAVRPMHIVLSEIRYNKEPFEEAFLVHENDLLVTRYNGSKEFVGCCGVVPNITVSIGYPDKLIRCRPKIKNQWHSKFLQYYLSQGEARKFIRSKIKTTSGQNGLAGGDLKKVTVKVPDLGIQKTIVENIEEKLIAFENIENTTNITLLKVKSLRQSILKEAFEGKLV